MTFLHRLFIFFFPSRKPVMNPYALDTKRTAPAWLEGGWQDWEAQEGLTLAEWERARSTPPKGSV